ncbi:putative ATPase with chaperone activity [Caldalkalibacillus uzonensis]|uniref:ATPase with chaperone activity n=1 Tax=Caldalkalibacillus uzonensis TaxID=353224 RepID=A0ABU0CWP8_9BACI|nr:ATP-binding protein [Caldalkalibacillus uzonensis]MDQ0340841.1 putative ATPase with chaperone activity [Caldalkalibacillus uzonensis]
MYPCSAAQIERYRAKLSGPIIDRIDLQVDVPLLSYDEIVGTATPHNDHYSTSNIRQRVEQALLFKQERTNSDKPNGLLTA